MRSRGPLKQLAWTREELFVASREYFSEVLKSCAEARFTIDIEVYILVYDDVGKSLILELNKAAARGVRVRLLVDGIGSSHWIQGPLGEISQTGIDFRVYHPLAPPLPMWSFRGLPNFTRFLKALLSINRRNHKKVFLFDGKKAFVGGVNVSEASLEWKDVGVLVEGPGVDDLKSAFALNWGRAISFLGGPVRLLGSVRSVSKQWSNPFVELNHLLRLRRKRMRKLLSRIDDSVDRVWVANPYWVPSPQLVAALMRAAQRGVDVRLCFPSYSDVFFTRWVGDVLLAPLLPYGVKLYEFRNGFVHAKYILIDGWARVGSTNLNYRSQYHDLEADIVLCSEKNISTLATEFFRYCSQSKQLSVEDFSQRPWVLKLAARFFLLFKRWI